MIIVPVISLLSYGSIDSFQVINEKKYLFFNSSINTFYLLTITILVSLFLGLFPAWYITIYQFKFRKTIDFLMYLPLAIPTYIMAFSYGEILSYTGPFQTFLRFYFEPISNFFNRDYLTIEILGIILGLSLYPYVYAACRISFGLIGNTYLNLSESLGNNWFKTFFKVVIPLSVPSILSAFFLVSMEVLNEYGAVKYFGINTFTTEIFKSWYSLNDESTAVSIAIILLLVVFVIFSFEYFYNSKLKFNYSPNSKINYTQNQKTLIFPYLFSFFPIVFGFFIPLFFILFNVVDNIGSYNLVELTSYTANSIFISVVSSSIIVLLLLFILFVDNQYKSGQSKILNLLTSLGYALPGAVLGLALIIFSRILNNIIDISLIGTFSLLIYALVIRFLVVGRSPLKSSIEKIPQSTFEKAQNLGLNNYGLLKKIYLPLNKLGIISAFMLCFIDVMKELPITLILMPFNFNTLSTKTYELAVEEMIDLSSIYSLLIIGICSLTLFVVKKYLNK
jgi:iron(III) transport system permease protein